MGKCYIWKYTNIVEALDHDVITFRWWMKYVKIRLGSENCEKRTLSMTSSKELILG